MNIQIITAFIIYISILLVSAYLFSKRSKSSSEFILGGRSTNYIVTAIALQASDMSHWMFVALPGIIYACGLIRIWELVGYVLFMFLNWQFVAPRLRRQTKKLNAITLFSYFEKRFNDTSGLLRITSALIAILFFTFFISSGLVALGRVFESAFGLDYHIGIVVSIFTILTYTLLGGFSGVAWFDFFQGLFAMTVIVIIPIVAYIKIGNWQLIIDAIQVKAVPTSILPTKKNISQIISLLLIWGPAYFGQPQLLSFFMGIKNPKNIKYAKYIGFFWQVIVATAAICIGLISAAYFTSGGEMIVVSLTKTIFSPFIAGFILCAILAATITTLDSQILSAGSAIAEDVYKKVFKRNATSKQVLWASKIGSLLVAGAALLLSINTDTSVYAIIHFAWCGMGSAFGPLVLTALYSQNINKYGAFAGIIVGATATYLLPYITTSIYPLIPSFLLSLAAIYLVSYGTRSRLQS